MKLSREQIKSILIIVAVFILTNLLVRGPDFIKYLKMTEDKWYTGQASWFDPWDHNVYFSAIGWGRRDGILFTNLYDTTAEKPLFIYTIYTMIGKIFSRVNYSNALIFHLTGAIFSLILLTIVWWFIGVFIKEFWQKLFSFLIISVGGGLGWLLFPQVLTPDISQPGFTLESALRRPHEAVSSGLFLLTIGNFWLWTKTKKPRYLVFSFLSSFFMSLFHPYSFLTIGLVLFFFVLWKYAKTKQANFFKGYLFLMSSGLIWFITIGRTLINNPGFSGLLSQVQSSPDPLLVILGWGVIFPLSLITLFSKQEFDEINFLKIWFTAGWLIIYLPVGFQRLLIRGLWLPAVVLAVVGIKKIIKNNRQFVFFASLILIFTSLSMFYTVNKRLTETKNNRWIYLNKEEGDAIYFLNQHGHDEEGVMAGYRIANIIPAVTRKKVWAGHSFQSPSFDIREKKVSEFYSGVLKQEPAKLFLKETKSAWVFFGPDEQLLNKARGLPYKFLKPVIIKSNLILYKVSLPL